MARKPRREWGSGSIYRTSKGYWRVSVPLPSDGLGRRRQEWQYRTEAAARRQLESVQRRLSRGLPAEESSMTVAEYAPQWLAALQVKDSTKAMYDSILRNQMGWLGDLRLTRIGPPDIRELLAEREREGYSGRTRRAILDILRMVFRMAESDGIVERNPAALVDAPRVDAKEPVHFTAEQVRVFLDAIRGDSLYSLYAMAIGTGLRRGELLALTWRDVDTRNGTVVVRRAKTRAGERVTPIPAFAQRALEETPKGAGPIWPFDASYVTRHLTVLCERHGLPRITPHGLRHTYATLMREANVSLETRRGLMGHSRTEMTLFYSHGQEAEYKRAVGELERLVG
jgi:integrase